MSAITRIPESKLPLVSWNVNDDLRVESYRNDRFSRTFELISSGGSSSVSLNIEEPGRCVQEWRQEDNQHPRHVKMFSTRLRRQTYFVVVDVYNRTLTASLETLNDDQWDRRLLEEEPDLQRTFFPRLFGRGNDLPSSPGWCKIKTDIPSIWIRRHEQSEVGISRELIRITGGRCSEEVLYAAYAENTLRDSEDPQLWRRAHVAERKTNGVIEYFGEILNLEEMAIETAQVPLESGAIHRERQNKQMRGSYGPLTKGWLGLALIENDPDSMYLGFMPGCDLITTTHQAIATWFQQHALKMGDVAADYSMEGIVVTKEMHAFRHGLSLETIHIHLSRTWPRIVLGCLNALVPPRTAEAAADERHIYGAEFNGDAIREAVLRPNSDVDNRVEGFDELNRAHQVTASVDIWLSADRTIADASVSDHGPIWTYRQREWVAARITALFAGINGGVSVETPNNTASE